MGGRYGMSFASKLVEQGKYEEAIASATQEIADGSTSPEIFADRASAYDYLERYAEAVDDFEKALELDENEQQLDRFLVDDAYFSALVNAARKDAEGSKDAAVKRLERYRKNMPDGSHLTDVDEWKLRVKGELLSLLDKTVSM